MMFSRYRMFGLCALMAMALVVAACGGDDGSDSESGGDSKGSSKPTGEPIIIGIQTDQSGPGASFNLPATEVTRALVAELNENGGLLGRPVEIVEENDESDPTKAPTTFRKLVDQGAKFVFHHSGGAANIQVKPVAKELQIPTIASTHSGAVFPAPPDNEFVYILAPPSTVWADLYCNGLEAAKIDNIAVLMDDTPAIASFSKTVLGGLDCVDVIASETAAVNTIDLSAQVARIKAAKPEAVLTFSAGTTFEITAQNELFQQMPNEVRLMTAALGNAPDAWKVVNPGALNGAVFVTTVDPKNEATQKVAEHLKELIGDKFAMTQFTAQAYDSFRVFVEAVESAGTTDGPAVNAAIQQINGLESILGPQGTTISFSADNHIGTKCAVLLVEFGKDNKPVGPWEFYRPVC